MKGCKNHGKRACWTCLWATVAFPLEHAAWVYLPGFRNVAHVFGL